MRRRRETYNRRRHNPFIPQEPPDLSMVCATISPEAMTTSRAITETQCSCSMSAWLYGRAKAPQNSLWSLRGRSSGSRTAETGIQGQTSRTAFSDSFHVAGTPRRNRHAGGDPEEALAGGHICRFRQRPQQGDQPAARVPGGRCGEPAFCGNSAAARLSIHCAGSYSG